MNTHFTFQGKSLLLALFLLALPSFTLAQVVDNKGTDFYMGFMPNTLGIGAPSIEVHLTADVATNVTVQYPVNAPTFDTTVPVTPGTITVVTVPVNAANGWTFGAVQNNAVRAFGPSEFVAYMINRAPFSSDAALALPVDALNTDYRVFSYTPQFVGSQFLFVAAFDNTTVTVTPSAPLRSGEPAGTPFNVTLDQGEGWYGISAGASGAGNDLTGTLVEADKPITLTNGDGCTQVPPGTTACDHIFEVAQPLASWGNDVVVSPLPNRPFGSRYRVLASEDNTTVMLDGGAFATLNAGQFAETSTISGPHVFNADKPIFVAQFMTGVTGSGSAVGDPAMGNMTPSEQYLSAYTFSTVGGGQFVDHFLSVIAENDDVSNGTITLDGTPIPAASFTSIPNTSFSFAQIELVEGTHSTSSGGVHGITAEGYNSADSYIYPGGARFQFINQGEDDTSPVCAGTLNGTTFSGMATDLLSDDPENRGIFFVVLSDDSENLALAVDPFTPGDESVSYTVTLVDPTMDGTGSVVVTDGAGNICSTPIEILVDGGPDLDTTAPVCGQIVPAFQGPGGAFSGVTTSASDAESGIASVAFTSLVNLDGFVDSNGPFAQGDVFTTADPNPTSVSISGERISYSTGGRIVVTVTNGAGLSRNCDPVVGEISAAVPEATGLAASYPNPFRAGAGAVQVPFRLAEASDVHVTVYDVLGRAVATLADGPMVAGSYEVSWPEASSLAPGTYVVRLTAGAFTQTQRITILR